MDNGDEATALNRRGFLGLMAGTAGAAAMAGVPGVDPAAALPMAPFKKRGKLRRRPNFLIIMVDEMRYAPMYESAALKAWRRKSMPNINGLRQHGMEFHNHHIMSSACTPSRTSIFTGQYPSLHGVSQTDGSAKSAIEEDMYWLDPSTVPTMGHYFRAAGYETLYKGKWHVTEDALFQPGTYEPLPSYTSKGVPDPELEDIYLEAGMLEQFGFTGWIGPEPHGSSPYNSGSSAPNGRGRDSVYAKWGVQEVRRLRKADKPWLLVTSFINPHDITLWGNLTLASQNYYLMQQLEGSTVPREPFDSRFAASAAEDLLSKPRAQASYRDVYADAFQPTENNTPYHRFYYQLQAEVDKHVGKVLDAVQESSERFQRDTVIIFLSDHGDLLGAHGGLYQKWHCSYDEMLKVPFVIHNPALFPKAQDTDVLTSHADLIPTMLGLAGIDVAQVQRELRKTHTQVFKLPGRDLSPLLLGERPEKEYNAPQYYMSDDMVTRGSQNVNIQGKQYRPVVQPCHTETVIAMLPTGKGGAQERWKYTRYFDNPDFWSSPGEEDVFTIIEGKVNEAGEKTATTTVKTTPEPDEFEMYNVTADPTEMNNLAGKAEHAATEQRLKRLLNGQRRKKRLEPRILKRLQTPGPGIGV